MFPECGYYRIYDSITIIYLIVVCVHGIFPTRLELFKSKDFKKKKKRIRTFDYRCVSHRVYWFGFVTPRKYEHIPLVPHGVNIK